MTNFIGEVSIKVVKCSPKEVYLWESVGQAQLQNGTKVEVGRVIPSGSLYLFIGKERYLVSASALLSNVLELIEKTMKAEEK